MVCKQPLTSITTGTVFRSTFSSWDGFGKKLRRSSFLFILQLIVMTFDFSTNQLALSLIFLMSIKVHFSPVSIRWYFSGLVLESDISKR
jgi:hypothetical protein